MFRLTACPGWTGKKCAAIRTQLDQEMIERHVRLAYSVDGWIASHAGMNPYYIKTPAPVIGYCEMVAECWDALKTGKYHELLYDGSRMNGRTARPGGILWQDWDEEFAPVSGINQIVGHTPGRGARTNRTPYSYNVCLDTRLDHYAIVREDGSLEIYRSDSHMLDHEIIQAP